MSIYLLAGIVAACYAILAPTLAMYVGRRLRRARREQSRPGYVVIPWRFPPRGK